MNYGQRKVMGTNRYGHLAKEVQILQKLFILEVDELSFGFTVFLTVRSRFASHTLRRGLGGQGWII